MGLDSNMPTELDSNSERLPPIQPTIHAEPEYGQVGTAVPYEPTELLGHQQAPQELMAWFIFTTGQRTGEMVRVKGKTMLIGRAEDCDLCLNDSAVSRQHARLRIETDSNGTHFVLHDLATENGIYVNSTRQQAIELKNGDHIQIGRVELTFKLLV